MLGETPEAGRLRRSRELVEDQLAVRPEQVVEAVNRALDSTPLYRRLGYPPRVESLDQVTSLPLLEKTTVCGARPSELMPRGLAVASVLATGELELITSSGSSAQASVWIDPNDADVLPPAAYEMVGTTLEAMQRVHLLSSPVCSGGLCEIGGEGDFVMLPPTADVFLEPDAYFESVWSMLDDLPPGLLLTNPAILCAVLGWARRRGLRVRLGGAVVSTYQRITKSQRRYIEEVSGLPVVNQYGATELAGCIAANGCVHGTLHVWSRRCFVEVVNARGGPVAGDEEGDIVITNVAANGTCLIRYRVGDRGRMRVVTCPCGVTSLALEVSGRSADTYVHRGQTITEALLDATVGADPNVVTWQFTRRPVGPPVITVIAGDEHPDLGALRANLIEQVCDDVIVRVDDRVTASRAQKYPVLKSFDGRALA